MSEQGRDRPRSRQVFQQRQLSETQVSANTSYLQITCGRADLNHFVLRLQSLVNLISILIYVMWHCASLSDATPHLHPSLSTPPLALDPTPRPPHHTPRSPLYPSLPTPPYPSPHPVNVVCVCVGGSNTGRGGATRRYPVKRYFLLSMLNMGTNTRVTRMFLWDFMTRLTVDKVPFSSLNCKFSRRVPQHYTHLLWHAYSTARKQRSLPQGLGCISEITEYTTKITTLWNRGEQTDKNNDTLSSLTSQINLCFYKQTLVGGLYTPIHYWWFRLFLLENSSKCIASNMKRKT